MLARSSKPHWSVPETASSVRRGAGGVGTLFSPIGKLDDSDAIMAGDGVGGRRYPDRAATTASERAAQPTMAPWATTISSVAFLKCAKYDSVASDTTRQS